MCIIYILWMCVYDDNVNYVHGNNYLLCVRNDFVYTFFYYYYFIFFNCVQFCFNFRTARQKRVVYLASKLRGKWTGRYAHNIIITMIFLAARSAGGGPIFFVKQIDRILYASFILIFIILIMYKTKRISYFNAITRKKMNMYVPRNNRIAIN